MDLLVGVILEFVEPVLEVEEGPFVGDIVD